MYTYMCEMVAMQCMHLQVQRVMWMIMWPDVTSTGKEDERSRNLTIVRHSDLRLCELLCTYFNCKVVNYLPLDHFKNLCSLLNC